jgi:hypothetical protein
MTDFISLACNILSIIRYVDEAAQKVDMNQKLCQNIAKRCELLNPGLETIKSWTTSNASKDINLLLLRLQEEMNDVKIFIKKFICQDFKNFGKERFYLTLFISRETDYKRFDEFEKLIQYHV